MAGKQDLRMGDESILPFLSKFDPPQQSEGNLDPLGLYSIADSLGVRLAPGVRERQTTPRFLTLALVGMVAYGDAMDDAIDAKTNPSWLVYEWLVVEALVRHFRGTDELQGIPGREKVQATLDAGDAVCARNYLKTPSVFGFHGVYRVFGVKAGLFDVDGRPLDPGYRILSAWEKDQGLEGFLDGQGPGRDFRRAIERAVCKGMANGQGMDVGADMRRAIAEHLHPRKSLGQENEALWSALTDSDPLRGEYARMLVSPEGRDKWVQLEGSEAGYHQWLLDQCSPSMRQLLQTILAYERMARLLMDAFDEMRSHMTEARQPVDIRQLESGDALRYAFDKFRSSYSEVLKELAEIDANLRMRAERSFVNLAEAASPEAFAEGLLDHHAHTQKRKPPNGKRAWFDRFGDGRVAIRPGYVIDEFERSPGRYVHAYRCRPLSSFGQLLGQIHSVAASS